MAVKRELKLAKLDLTVSNPDKVLYPAGKFTKAQVIDYYVRIAPVLLPHLKDRPLTLKRYPDGIFGNFFYEKDAPGFTPDWVKRVPVPRRDSSLPPIQYIVANDVRTLAWLANLAALELHPFLHRAPDLDCPTHLAFDLDPGEEADVLSCAEVAFILKEVLEKLRLKSFPKVSGSKGIQLYVPLNTPVTYGATQAFAKAMAELLASQHPDRIVSAMAKTLRRGKVFIDWSQNSDHKTTVAVYSLRAKRERPYVSAPVGWDELRTAVKRGDPEKLYWDAAEMLARVRKVRDLFAPVLKLKQRLPEPFGAFHQRPEDASESKPGASKPRSLVPYAEKRDFSRTREPAAALARRSAQGSRRRFVVQKHAASHLHYDFRLEIGDVLKSWAVPKGVPRKPSERVSAFPTEDHPLEYLHFEGTIPQGQYGGGTVMVWDTGSYDVVEGNFWKGRLVVHLNGKKLKGEWTLDRLEPERGKERWLLTKTSGPSKRIPAKQQPVSALTGRTIEQIALDGSSVWHSHRHDGGARKAPEKRTHSSAAKKRRPVAKATPPDQTHRRASGRKVPAPDFVPPMKASLVSQLPQGGDWLYEVKWDGYRALALKHGEKIRLLSLKQKNLGADFPSVIESLRSVPADTAIIDGEVVAVDNRGHPSFQVLQNRRSLGRGWHIVYYAFDLLNLEGEDLRRRPLQERRDKLQQLVESSTVRFSAELPGAPEAVIPVVQNAGLEGIVAKRRDSVYRAGTRVETWLKFKLDKAQEFVIGGYSPDGASFQSLLAGYYDGEQFMFAGKVRQGFTPGLRASLMKAMRPLAVKDCPFANLPTGKKSHFGEGITLEDMKKLVWLKPRLVGQVRFTEWTNYGLLRHATFVGLRDDKEPREVRREEPVTGPK